VPENQGFSTVAEPLEKIQCAPMAGKSLKPNHGSPPGHFRTLSTLTRSLEEEHRQRTERGNLHPYLKCSTYAVTKQTHTQRNLLTRADRRIEVLILKATENYAEMTTCLSVWLSFLRGETAVQGTLF